MKTNYNNIRFSIEHSISSLQTNRFEIYNINVFNSPKFYEINLSQFIDILKYNLNQLQSFIEGDIIKMKGTKLWNRFVLYHHHAIYSDVNKCKIIHKW
jgi:hypothetical protein